MLDEVEEVCSYVVKLIEAGVDGIVVRWLLVDDCVVMCARGMLQRVVVGGSVVVDQTKVVGNRD